jgi:Prokaryotic N-terminal methylation motif
MIRRPPPTRQGFTLLEVVLSFAIGMVLLWGLYSAIETSLRLTEIGREVVEHAALARSLTARISSDIAPCVGIPDPGRYKSRSGAASTTTGQPAQTGQTGQSGQNGQGMGMTTTEEGEPVVDVVRAFEGTENVLKVYVSRVPRATSATDSMRQSSASGVTNAANIESDQRLITYWLAGGGDRPLGLARHEMPLTTATGESVPTVVGGSNEEEHVIATEVVGLMFRYYDGISWSPEWDGTAVEAENTPPKGPPLAVAVEFEIEIPGTNGAEATRKFVRHVIAIPTAGGKPQTNLTETPPEEPAPMNP